MPRPHVNTHTHTYVGETLLCCLALPCLALFVVWLHFCICHTDPLPFVVPGPKTVATSFRIVRVDNFYVIQVHGPMKDRTIVQVILEKIQCLSWPLHMCAESPNYREARPALESGPKGIVFVGLIALIAQPLLLICGLI